MAAFTLDDWHEALYTLRRRGGRFFLSKLNPSGLARTRSTFGDENLEVAHWWIVPGVRRRWNMLITGNPDLRYEDHLMQGLLKGRKGLRMLSLGCGIASHERYLARYEAFEEILAIDLSQPLISGARRKASEEGLENIRFEVADVNQMKLEPQSYDVVLFHASLHHFAHLEKLIGKTIYQCLKSGGVVVINEYVGPNRLQWTESQLAAANDALHHVLPPAYRQYLGTSQTKKNIYGPGRLRMKLSDPSEAVEAEKILPLLHQHFKAVEEKPYGGNLLVPVLKHIAHHLVEDSEENRAILAELFRREDELLEQEASIMWYGVYQKG